MQVPSPSLRISSMLGKVIEAARASWCSPKNASQLVLSRAVHLTPPNLLAIRLALSVMIEGREYHRTGERPTDTVSFLLYWILYPWRILPLVL